MDKPDRPLPDPWLFDSEALLRELDHCRETVLQIPITNPNATHFGIQLALTQSTTLLKTCGISCTANNSAAFADSTINPSRKHFLNDAQSSQT